jgi:hypothetical protein
MSEKKYSIPIIRESGSVSSTPPAQFWKMYPKTDGWYILGSDGIEHKLIVGQTSSSIITNAVWNGSAISSTFGGTGLSSYAVGDTLYASGINTLSNLAIGSSGQVLTVVAGIPSWANLPAGVTGTGTTNKLTKWLTSTSLADSIVSESGTTLTVDGNTVINTTSQLAFDVVSSNNINALIRILQGGGQAQFFYQNIGNYGTGVYSSNGRVNIQQSNLFVEGGINSTGSIGAGITATAKLHIQGTGSTSSTYTAKFDNAANVTSMSIRDDGQMNIQSSRFGININSDNVGILVNAPTNADGINIYASGGFDAGRFENTGTGNGIISLATSNGKGIFSQAHNGTSIAGQNRTNSSNTTIARFIESYDVAFTKASDNVEILRDATSANVATYNGVMLNIIDYQPVGSNTSTGDILNIIKRNSLNTGYITALNISQSGNIGIGTPNASNTLHVVGTLRYVDGNAALGKILTSDANGVATWQNAPTTGPTGTGTPNRLTKWATSTALVDSLVFETNNMIHINGTIDNGSTPVNTRLNIHSSNTGPNYDAGFCFSDSAGNWPTSIRQINNSLYIDLSGGGPTQAFGTGFKLKPVGSGTCALTIGGDVDGNLITNALFSVRNKDYAGASSTIQSNNDTGYSSQDFYVNTSTNTMNNLGSLTAYAFNINPILNNVFSLYATSLASNMYFDDRSSGGLVFGTGGSRRSIINPSGKWGINNLTPTAQLHIVGTGSTNSTYTTKFDNASNNPSLWIRDDGSVGIGTDLASMPNAQFPLVVKTTNTGTGILITDSGGSGRFHMGSGASNYFESQNSPFTFWKGSAGGSNTSTNHLFTIGVNGRTSFVNDAASPDYQGWKFYIEHNNADAHPQTGLFVNNIVSIVTAGTQTLYAGQFQTVGVSGITNVGISAIATGGINNYAIVVPPASGDVGIGTITPTNTLHLVGSFKYIDGNQGAGKILTSDGNGVATWQNASVTSTGTVTKYSVTLTPGTAGTANTITHNMNSTDISISLWDSTSGEIIYAKVNNRTSNTVDVTFATNPTGTVRIVILS